MLLEWQQIPSSSQKKKKKLAKNQRLKHDGKWNELRQPKKKKIRIEWEEKWTERPGLKWKKINVKFAHYMKATTKSGQK